MKFILEMYPWSVNTSIIYYHQCSTTASHFVLIYIITTLGKNSLTLSAVNVWTKIQTAFRDVILINLTTTQLKTLLPKKSIDKY